MLIAKFGIPGDSTDDIAIHPPADVPHVIANVARRQNHRDARNRCANALYVSVSDSVLQYIALTAFIRDLLFFGRFDAANDNILAAKVFYMFLSFVARAFSNGQHSYQ